MTLIALKFYFKLGQSRPLFVYFRLFPHYTILKIDESVDGLEPGAAGWKARTNPLSYGGTHCFKVFMYLYS